jgi:hypothetical protein
LIVRRRFWAYLLLISDDSKKKDETMIGCATKKWICAVCVSLLAAGCATDTKPTNAKLEKALNTYFASHNVCLFPASLKFPYEVSPGSNSQTETKQLDAMTGAGLTARQVAAAIKVERYTLTPLGERVGGRFCYGHRVVASVDGFTPPVKQNGFLQTTVSYRTMMMDVPVWVKTDEMRAAFPEMAAAISGPQPGQMTLENAGAGWQVPQ